MESLDECYKGANHQFTTKETCKPTMALKDGTTTSKERTMNLRVGRLVGVGWAIHRFVVVLMSAIRQHRMPGIADCSRRIERRPMVQLVQR